MRIETKNERENPFLKRKEIDLIIYHEGAPTPSKAALEEEISKKFNAEKERIEIKKIMSVRGESKSVARVFIHEQPVREKEQKESQEKEASKEGETAGKEAEEKKN